MSKVLLVCGAGVGISKAVAERFGQEGYKVALISRSGCPSVEQELKGSGCEVQAFAGDLSDATAVKSTVDAVRAALGPISTLLYNESTAGGSGNLLECDVVQLEKAMASAVCGLISAVQACLEDLRAAKGAVLVTGGGLALEVMDPVVAKYAGDLGIQKAAQHKTASILHHKLKDEEVYVGEIIVAGLVAGTGAASALGGLPEFAGKPQFDPKTIADRFWQMHEARQVASEVMMP